MREHPKIKFKIDKNHDLLLYKSFLKDEPFLNSCFYEKFKEIESLKNQKISSKEKIKEVKKFLDEYYKKNKKEIEKGVEEINRRWLELDEDFFNLIESIFKKHPWPKGKYIAFSTIWDVYPRDIKRKTFSFPYSEKEKALVTIAHEMLHFIFYDYLYTHYPEYKKKKYKDEVWKLSEVFNIVIQSQKEWLNLFHQSPSFYPEHKELIEKLRRAWRKKEDIDYLIKLFF